ncbi:MAG: PHB depolymerase family esterase [Pseudomonadota bacterium]
MNNKNLLSPVLLLLFLAGSPAFAQLANRTVDVDGVTRGYLAYLPAGYDGSTAMPLMISFHGGSSTALDQLALSDMRALADQDGVILAYPQGLPEFPGGPTIWNSVGPFSNGVDEVGFVAALIDDLAAEFAIDESRVWASGYSNGANMAWELACFLSDRIAAIGPVAGSMWTWTENLCAPLSPVGVVSIHGTLDFYNPYDGGPPFSLGLIAASEYWVAQAGADATPTIVDVPNIAPGDGSTVENYTWANGENCVSIEHYRVQNGGHDWPGAFGNQDIDSTQVIWNYVTQYDLDGRIDCPDTQDSDEDGIADGEDNCTLVENSDQRDTDLDGYGNACDPDLTQDCAVNFLDLAEMKSVFFTADPDADLTGDGSVNFLDLGLMKQLFFEAPGPSGVGGVCD